MDKDTFIIVSIMSLILVGTIYITFFGTPWNKNTIIKKNIPKNTTPIGNDSVIVNATQPNNTEPIPIVIKDTEYYKLVGYNNTTINIDVIPLTSSVMRIVIIHGASDVSTEKTIVVNKGNNTFVVKFSKFSTPSIKIVYKGNVYDLIIKKYDEVRLEEVDSTYNNHINVLFKTFSTNIPSIVNTSVKIIYTNPSIIRVTPKIITNDVVTKIMFMIDGYKDYINKIIIKYQINVEGVPMGIKTLIVTKDEFSSNVEENTTPTTYSISPVIIRKPNGEKVYIVPSDTLIANTTLTEQEFTTKYYGFNLVKPQYIDINNVILYTLENNVLKLQKDNRTVDVTIVDTITKNRTNILVNIRDFMRLLLNNTNNLYVLNGTIDDLVNGSDVLIKPNEIINIGTTYVIKLHNKYYIFTLPPITEPVIVPKVNVGIVNNDSVILAPGKNTIDFQLLLVHNGLLFKYDYVANISVNIINTYYHFNVVVNNKYYNVVSGITNNNTIYDYVSRIHANYVSYNGVTAFMVVVNGSTGLKDIDNTLKETPIPLNANISIDSGILTITIESPIKYYILLSGVNQEDVVTTSKVVYSNNYGIVIRSSGRTTVMVVGKSLQTLKGITILKDNEFVPILGEIMIPNNPIIFTITT